MDAFARGLKSAANIIKNGKFEKAIKKRYAGWDTTFGEKIESGKATLEDLEAYTFKNGDPEPQSGRQEYLKTC